MNTQPAPASFFDTVARPMFQAPRLKPILVSSEGGTVEEIERRIASYDGELAIERRCMAWSLGRGEASMVAAHRRTIERVEARRRKAVEQLQLAASINPKLEA
jgi:hypothetical protein